MFPRQFVISTATANGKVASSQLHIEVVALVLSVGFLSATTHEDADSLILGFDGEPTGGDDVLITAAVAAHDGIDA